MSTRRLGFVDFLAIAFNGIVGSGVYLLLAPLAGIAGAASVVGIAACSLLALLIGLCFAELASAYDEPGAAYLYTKHAFGRFAAFPVGWMSAASSVLALAAVAAGFAEAVTQLAPSLPRASVAVALIVALGVINFVGLRAGARTSNVLSAIKLAPLVLLALVGVAWIDPAVFPRLVADESIPLTADGARDGYWPAVAHATFLSMFMLSGFEFTPVPADEGRASRRHVPRALVGGLLGAAALYVVLQLVALSVLPDLAAREQPLLDVAAVVFGVGGARVLGAAAIVSMAGFAAGCMLVTPRYLRAFAADGFLPRVLTRSSRFDTPGPAIAVTTLLAALLAWLMGFRALVDVGTVALFCQFIPACASALVLRVRSPALVRGYRMPGGVVIPLVAMIASVALLVAAAPRREEWSFAALILGAGLIVWAATTVTERRRAR